ncbi:hypothetical protein VPHK290_0022 [Vibrio phage K290]
MLLFYDVTSDYIVAPLHKQRTKRKPLVFARGFFILLVFLLVNHSDT